MYIIFPSLACPAYAFVTKNYRFFRKKTYA